MGQRPFEGTTLCREATSRRCPGAGPEVSRRAAQRDRWNHCRYSDRLLVCRHSGDNPPKPRGTYFPILNSATQYEALKRQKLEGARQETITIIDALKPYKGGNNLLWMLQQLTNIDKHRLLLTVGLQAAGVNLADILRSTKRPVPEEAIKAAETLDVHIEASSAYVRSDPEVVAANPGVVADAVKLYFTPTSYRFPLKDSFELFTGDEESHPEMTFRFVIALNEPEIAEAKPLIPLVNQFTGLVERIAILLRRELA